MKKEENLQLSVCNYLRHQYPNVIFTCDLSSGMKLTMGQAIKATKMRWKRGMPDLMIFEPRGNWCGLFLELKVVTPFLKDGMTLKKDEHLKEQAGVMNELMSKGYYCHFGIGFDETKLVIDGYMKNNKFSTLRPT